LSQKRGAFLSLVYLICLSPCLFLLLTGQTVSAQQRLFTNQQHFGVEEGLPQSFISNILQDDDGFIWISTLDGICRYDGRGFKIFRHNPKDSTSIAANVMNNMQRLRNNSVIIFYNAELADNFNLHSLKASRNKNIDLLKHIPHASWKIEGKDMTTTNRLFMMKYHKGMGWLDTRTGEVFFANRANGLLQQDSLIDIVESAEGKLYLVSEDGVQVSDTGHKKFEWIPFATNVKK
jgi:ligand-binding sensor domain-containing protein